VPDVDHGAVNRPEPYETIDLAPWCVDVGEPSDGHRIGPGDRTFHGLPFRIARAGTGDTPGLILLEPGGSDVVVPVGRRTTRVLVAHRRLRAPGDEPAFGEQVATYTFELAERTETVPIRERFEIGTAPSPWDWQGPFLAVGAGHEEPLDRWAGGWGEAGYRQTEPPHRSSEVEVFLWSWVDPDPEAELISIRLTPVGVPVVVAAITLSGVDEDPFVRDPALPVIVAGARPPEGPVRWDVSVDRGVASYAYPLPGGGAETFLADPMPGFGEDEDPTSPLAYARIAAVPSATVAVSTPDGETSRIPWSSMPAEGSAAGDGVEIRVAESGRSWVHLRVVDDESGRPVPCRVHLRSPEGIPYQPHGHHDHVNSDLDTWHIDVGGDVRLGRLTYAYIDGTCQGWLPVGDVLVDVARGFEYEPIRQTVRIERGQRELELRLRRWTSANERGWYSGDSHVHFLSAQGALTEQQGEDLNVVNLLQSQWGSLFTNTEDFTGRPLATPDGRHVTYVSQENRQHVLGHLVLWGLREPVMPWCTDGPSESEVGAPLEVTESEWADRCHDQGGTVVIPHFPVPNGEPATLIATDRADAIEMIVQRRAFHEEYYRYLNCGYRLPLVGGTDKMSSDVPVGLYRTYAYLGDEPFDYDAWRRAVVAGRTFLSGGPLLKFSVDGHAIGDTVHVDGGGTVTVEATAESVFPLSVLQIVRNGEVVAEATGDGVRRLEVTAEVGFDDDGWLAARCGGGDYFDGPAHRDVWQRGVFAHTSPAYVATGGRWSMFDPAHARYMLTLIEGSLAYMRERAVRFPDGYATHHHGEDDHAAVLERPFLEARRRLEERLFDVGGA
jgi:hypothetical protein